MILGIPLLRQLSLRLLLVVITDLKQRQAWGKKETSILFQAIVTSKMFTFCHVTL